MPLAANPPNAGRQAITPELTLTGLEPDLVNTTTSNLQTDQVVAGLADGGYVVAWASYNDFGRREIYTQRYDAMGEEVGGETLAHTRISGGATAALPVLAGLADGGYLLAYEYREASSTAMTSTVYALRFDADGEPVGATTVVSEFFPYTAREYTIVGAPSVAPLSDGGYVIGWANEYHNDNPGASPSLVLTTMVQRYDSAGLPVGSPTALPGNTPVQALSDGGFAVGDTLFDSTGMVVGVSGADDSSAIGSATEALSGGGYVVAWLAAGNLLYQQMLDSSGVPVGAPMPIGTGGPESLPEVVALSGGDHVVLWLARPAAGLPLELLAQRFDESGAAVGTTLHIDTPDPYVAAWNQKPPAVTALEDGGFAVSWVASGPAGPDVFTQLFAQARLGTDGADQLAGTGANDVLLGLAGFDRIDGLAGDDKIDGGAGRDMMAGGTGDDSYFVDDAKDRVVERADEGHDKVYSSVSHELDRNVEDLVLTGAAAIDGTGNALDNRINGTPGANRLEGAAGDDTLKGFDGDDLLAGGTGNDRLDGGAGADAILFDEQPGVGNVDVLVNFVTYEDVIHLDGRIFRALGAGGALDADAFQTGAGAMDADDRVIYDPAGSALLYDPDGTGDQAAVQIATFVGLVGILSAEDFVVV